MSEMIERVAKAIVKRHFYDPEPEAYESLDAFFDGLEPQHMDDARDMARAALEALRKPTPKMCKAACKAMSPGERPTDQWVSNSAKHGIRYIAMIDEALR